MKPNLSPSVGLMQEMLGAAFAPDPIHFACNQATFDVLKGKFEEKPTSQGGLDFYGILVFIDATVPAGQVEKRTGRTPKRPDAEE